MFEGMPRRASDLSKNEEFNPVHSETQEANETKVEAIEELTRGVDAAIENGDLEKLGVLQKEVWEQLQYFKEIQTDAPNDAVIKNTIKTLNDYRSKAINKADELRAKRPWREAA